MFPGLYGKRGVWKIGSKENAERSLKTRLEKVRRIFEVYAQSFEPAGGQFQGLQLQEERELLMKGFSCICILILYLHFLYRTLNVTI